MPGTLWTGLGPLGLRPSKPSRSAGSTELLLLLPVEEVEVEVEVVCVDTPPSSLRPGSSLSPSLKYKVGRLFFGILNLTAGRCGARGPPAPGTQRGTMRGPGATWGPAGVNVGRLGF